MGTKQTDREAVLQYLKQHKTITPMEALNAFGCYRLGARIYDLRRDGYCIDTEIVHDRDRFGEVAKFARYHLREESEDVLMGQTR